MKPIQRDLLLLTLLTFLVGIVPSYAGQLSTSLAGIVTPSSRSERIKIFRTPVQVAFSTYSSQGTFSQIVSFGSPAIPNSAIGVFLYVDAITDVYFSMTNSEVLTSPPPNPPIPAGTLVGNILQMGASSGGYPAPIDRHYRDTNIFYLPLRPADTHTITLNFVKGSVVTKEVTFKIDCLGYIE